MSYLQYAQGSAQEVVARLMDEHPGHGSRKLAPLAGLHDDATRKVMQKIKARAALAGYAPEHSMTKTVPDGYHVKGVSTLYNSDGAVSAQWVKSDIDSDRQEAILRETIAAMRENIPRLKAIKAPKQCKKNLLNLYVITDYHFGCLSWPEETRSDGWDLSIAESMLLSWFEAAIASSPEAETGVMCNLGDFLHFDSLDAITPTGKNLLDSDTRFTKIVRTVIHTIRRVVDMLLHKHKHVHLIMAEGNHDLASSVWLREMFSAMYAGEKRITVDVSPDPYYCVEHGQTALFFHHGHKKKPAAVDTVFAAKFREVFGRTKFAYAHMGHMHHSWVKESNLMIVEQHRTLAASDAYASRGGWMSGREASVITYHRDYGCTGRVTITPDMLR